MKNVTLVLLLLVCSLFSQAQIINFPDANFKNALVNTKCVDTDGDGNSDDDVDTNNDGEIAVSEASNVMHLNVSSRQISSVVGIENFKNLISLSCSSNQLPNLNIQSLTNLTSLFCGGNIISSLNVQGLTNLTSLHCYNNQLTALNVEGLTNLTNLACFLNQLTSLNVEGLIQLRQLHCYSNQLGSLNVKGLTNLTFLDCYGNQLTSLNVEDLPNLITLSCSSNQLTSLNVQDLTKLTSLDCYGNQLTSLKVKCLTNLTSLSCSSNQLITLDVQSLTKLKGLSCSDNKLSSLFIKGANLLQDPIFERNLNLNYICCNEEIRTYIKSTVILNGQNCEVNSYCSFTPGGKFYVLNGENSLDNNSNGCDDLDLKLPNTKYSITNGTIAGSFISSSAGNYQIPLQDGNYTITPILENPLAFNITPATLQVTFPSTSDTITQNFCITPKGIYRQTNVTVLPLSPPARPGFDASYKIIWENKGNQIESGTLNFTYNEALLDYVKASQNPDIIADGILKWNFANLLPFEKREIIVTLRVNRPTDVPAVNVGDKLYLTASILDNIFTLENTVVGSYDPNDKTCLQGDRVKPEMVGEFVDYLIRFENTGNYAAENVVVKDIIDTKRFDVASLQITDASHQAYARIDGNKVEFIFENIQLPFDDENNDGYIAFKIKTLFTLVLGDSLKNKADIYFDYNFPIRTNEAQTTINNPIVGTKDIISDVKIYPNPVKDILTFETNEAISKVEIYSVDGRIIRSMAVTQNRINIGYMGSGAYIAKVFGATYVSYVKIVKL